MNKEHGVWTNQEIILVYARQWSYKTAIDFSLDKKLSLAKIKWWKLLSITEAEDTDRLQVPLTSGNPTGVPFC